MTVEALDIETEFVTNLKLLTTKIGGTLNEMKPNENQIYSPLSIQMSGAMINLGADGRTARQLIEGLGLGENYTVHFNDILNSCRDMNALQIANRLYIMSTFKLHDQFNESLAKEFFSTAELINFAENTNAARIINEWVESQTNNYIKSIISPTDIDENTRLILVNAIYFKGVWKQAFSKDLTKPDDFFLNQNETVKVDFMYMMGAFRYAYHKKLKAAALELPYSKSNLSMIIVLPDPDVNLTTVEKNPEFAEVQSQLGFSRVEIKIPKFTAELKVELTPVFQQLGIKKIFEDPEFSNMVISKEPLAVTNIFHKAFIETNEEGTEAAAATGVTIASRSSKPSAPPVFHVNRPFLFSIVNTDGVQIFSGKVLKFSTV